MKTMMTMLLCILTTGCITSITTVSRKQLDDAIAAHTTQTFNGLVYAGSMDGYHYVVHGTPLCEKIYRVPISQLKVEKPFPFTTNEAKWRTIKRHCDGWCPQGTGPDGNGGVIAPIQTNARFL